MHSYDKYSVISKIQRLLTQHRTLLARQLYLREQLTSIERQILSQDKALTNQEQEIDAVRQRIKQLQNDKWLDKLFSVAQNKSQADEIERYMQGWGIGTPEQPFDSPAHCIIWHANKHGDGKILKYLRQANNFNKRRAKRKWVEGAKKWTRKSGEYLIERDGKIVSYENS